MVAFVHMVRISRIRFLQAAKSRGEVFDFFLSTAPHLRPRTVSPFVMFCPGVELDHRFRGVHFLCYLVLGGLDSVLPPLLTRQKPGRVYVVRWQIAQYRNPSFHILAKAIIILRLLNRIELTKSARIVPNSGNVLPVHTRIGM